MMDQSEDSIKSVDQSEDSIDQSEDSIIIIPELTWPQSPTSSWPQRSAPEAFVPPPAPLSSPDNDNDDNDNDDNDMMMITLTSLSWSRNCASWNARSCSSFTWFLELLSNSSALD